MKKLVKLWIGIITAAIAVTALAVVAPQFYKNQFAGSFGADVSGLVAASSACRRAGCFSEIRVVENTFMRERRGMGDYTYYRTDVECPSGSRIISGHCDPQHSLWMFPSHYNLNTTTNKFECEFVSERVSDAIIAARAVCVR